MAEFFIVSYFIPSLHLVKKSIEDFLTFTLPIQAGFFIDNIKSLIIVNTINFFS